MKPRNRLLFYTGYFLLWTVGICAAGAAVGAISFPIVGALIGAESSTLELIGSGAAKLGFLSFIWAPGTAIVLCFHRAYRNRHKTAGSTTSHP